MKAQPCTARRTDGEPCKALALYGTSVCRHHGGSAPQVRRKAQQNIMQAHAQHRLGILFKDQDFGAIDDPVQKLLELAAEAWVMKNFFRDQIEQLRYATDLGGEQLRAEVALYERAMDRCLKILASISNLGIAERRTRIQEAQAAMILSMLSRIEDRLELTPAQRQVWVQVVPEELRALTSAEPEA